jgi:molybdate transport system regulatory protein
MRVELRLAGADAGPAAGGMPLLSRITRESVQLLGLAPGLRVLALCKATAVAVNRSSSRREGRNCLPGIATRVSRAASGGEVALELAGGLQLVGFAAAGHVLRTRDAVVAEVDESAVAIALPG